MEDGQPIENAEFVIKEEGEDGAAGMRSGPIIVTNAQLDISKAIYKKRSKRRSCSKLAHSHSELDGLNVPEKIILNLILCDLMGCQSPGISAFRTEQQDMAETTR